MCRLSHSICQQFVSVLLLFYYFQPLVLFSYSLVILVTPLSLSFLTRPGETFVDQVDGVPSSVMVLTDVLILRLLSRLSPSSNSLSRC